jgi:hypothetical protein
MGSYLNSHHPAVAGDGGSEMETAPRDYWLNRCRIAETRMERLISESNDQGLGALVGMAICALCGTFVGFGFGWWLS